MTGWILTDVSVVDAAAVPTLLSPPPQFFAAAWIRAETPVKAAADVDGPPSAPLKTVSLLRGNIS